MGPEGIAKLHSDDGGHGAQDGLQHNVAPDPLDGKPELLGFAAGQAQRGPRGPAVSRARRDEFEGILVDHGHPRINGVRHPRQHLRQGMSVGRQPGALVRQFPALPQLLIAFGGDDPLHVPHDQHKGHLRRELQQWQAVHLAGTEQAGRQLAVRRAQAERQPGDGDGNQPFHVGVPDPEVLDVQAHAVGQHQGVHAEEGRGVHVFGGGAPGDGPGQAALAARNPESDVEIGVVG